MSQLTDRLELHLPLDEIDNQQVIDETDHHRDCAVHGPTLVADDDFGTCLSFDGADDFIDLPPAAFPAGGEITVAFWARGDDSLPQDTSVIWVGSGLTDVGGSRMVNIHLPWGTKVGSEQIVFDCGIRGGAYDRIQQQPKPDDYKGGWRHWAFTKDTAAKKMTVYLNGQVWLADNKDAPLPAAAKATLGCRNGENFYKGQLSNLRIYSRALPLADIQRVMDEDRVSSAVFRRTHPLGFELLDDDDQQVLCIAESAAGHKLRLEVHNTSRQIVEFEKLTGKAQRRNCHFELQFRPGTIQSLKDVTFEQKDGWTMERDPDADALYFLQTNGGSLGSDAKVELPILNITADGRGGARGTRVELRYHRLRYAASKDDFELDGIGVQHLSVVNERGKKHVPLHVGFVGPNQIVNDGQTGNECRIRITNLLPDAKLPLASAGTSPKPSRFVISFDRYSANEANQWALAANDLESRIGVSVKTPATPAPGRTAAKPWICTEEIQGLTGEWILTPAAGNDGLEEGQSVELLLTGIKSNLSSGPTNLYVRYENIPDYWDGQFVLTLEKGPIVVHDNLDANGNFHGSSYVGIGVAQPLARLSIAAQGATPLGGTGASTTLRTCAGALDPSGAKPVLTLASFGFTAGDDHVSLGVHALRLFPSPDGNWGSAAVGLHIAMGDLPFAGSGLWFSGDGVGIGTSLPVGGLHVTAPGRYVEEDANGLSVLWGVPIVAQNNGTAIGILNANGRQAFALNIDRNEGTKDKRGVPTFYDKYDGTWHSSLCLKNGNVGIGTVEQSARLMIDTGGGTASSLKCEHHGSNFVVRPAGAGSSSTVIENTAASLLINPGGGNVGIGTTGAGWKLDVAGIVKGIGLYAGNVDGSKNTPHPEGAWLEWNRDGGSGRTYLLNAYGGGTSPGIVFGKVDAANNATTQMFIDSNGNVGIGEPNPTKAKLVVTGGNSGRFWGYAYGCNIENDFKGERSTLNGNKDGDGPTVNFGIYSDAYVAGLSFLAISDQRMKDIIGRSEGGADLATLLKLEVTDYRYKDEASRGRQVKKKLVAQQVEEVFPQAVSQHTDVVPDIFEMAACREGWVTLSSDLKRGERVRLVSGDAEGIFEVAEVSDDGFRTDFKPGGSEVFVYGREVDDFRTVDYEAIAMLNVSATQQLKKEKDEEVRALRGEVGELKAANAALLARLERLEGRLGLAPINGSNGHGSHRSAAGEITAGR